MHSGAQEIQAVAFKFYWDKPESAVFAAPSLALIWVQPVGGGLIADANGVGDLRKGAFLRSLKLQGAYHAAASFFVRRPAPRLAPCLFAISRSTCIRENSRFQAERQRSPKAASRSASGTEASYLTPANCRICAAILSSWAVLSIRGLSRCWSQ